MSQVSAYKKWLTDFLSTSPSFKTPRVFRKRLRLLHTDIGERNSRQPRHRVRLLLLPGDGLGEEGAREILAHESMNFLSVFPSSDLYVRQESATTPSRTVLNVGVKRIPNDLFVLQFFPILRIVVEGSERLV